MIDRKEGDNVADLSMVLVNEKIRYKILNGNKY